MKNVTVASLTAQLTSDRDSAQRTLAKFVENFQINPLYALEWADSSFIAAAELEVSLSYLELIEYGVKEGFSEEAILAEVTKKVTRDFIFKGQQNANHSSGQCTNLLEGAKVKALADFYGWLMGF